MNEIPVPGVANIDRWRYKILQTKIIWLEKENRVNWSGKPHVRVDSREVLMAVLRERFSKAIYSDELDAAIEKLASDMLRPFGVLGFWEQSSAPIASLEPK